MDAYEFFSKYGIFIDVETVRAQGTPHTHSEYEIYYLLTGSRDYFVEEDFFVVKSGEFALVPKGYLHRTGGVGGKRFLVCFTVDVIKEIFSESIVSFLIEAFNEHHRAPQGANKERAVSILSEMCSLRESGDGFAVRVKLGELLFLVAESSPAQKENRATDLLVKKIVEFTNSNYATIKGIDEISQKFFLNKSYVCRVFKNAIGLSYTTYLNKVRLKKAVELLSSQQYNVSTVAEKCGFNSTAYFCKIFKTEYNITPLEFKGGANYPISPEFIKEFI